MRGPAAVGLNPRIALPVDVHLRRSAAASPDGQPRSAEPPLRSNVGRSFNREMEWVPADLPYPLLAAPLLRAPLLTVRLVVRLVVRAFRLPSIAAARPCRLASRGAPYSSSSLPHRVYTNVIDRRHCWCRWDRQAGQWCRGSHSLLVRALRDVTTRTGAAPEPRRALPTVLLLLLLLLDRPSSRRSARRGDGVVSDRTSHVWLGRIVCAMAKVQPRRVTGLGEWAHGCRRPCRARSVPAEDRQHRQWIGGWPGRARGAAARGGGGFRRVSRPAIGRLGRLPPPCSSAKPATAAVLARAVLRACKLLDGHKRRGQQGQGARTKRPRPPQSRRPDVGSSEAHRRY